MTKKCTKHAAARLQSVLKEYADLKQNYNELLVKFNHHTEIIAKQDELIQAQFDYIKTRDKLMESEVLYKKESKRDELHAALLKQIKSFPKNHDIHGSKRIKMGLLLQELKEYSSKRKLKDINEPIIIDEMYIKTEPSASVNTVSYPTRKTCIVM